MIKLNQYIYLILCLYFNTYFYAYSKNNFNCSKDSINIDLIDSIIYTPRKDLYDDIRNFKYLNNQNAFIFTHYFSGNFTIISNQQRANFESTFISPLKGLFNKKVLFKPWDFIDENHGNIFLLDIKPVIGFKSLFTLHFTKFNYFLKELKISDDSTYFLNRIEKIHKNKQINNAIMYSTLNLKDQSISFPKIMCENNSCNLKIYNYFLLKDSSYILEYKNIEEQYDIPLIANSSEYRLVYSLENNKPLILLKKNETGFLKKIYLDSCYKKKTINDDTLKINNLQVFFEFPYIWLFYTIPANNKSNITSVKDNLLLNLEVIKYDVVQERHINTIKLPNYLWINQKTTLPVTLMKDNRFALLTVKKGKYVIYIIRI